MRAMVLAKSFIARERAPTDDWLSMGSHHTLLVATTGGTADKVNYTDVMQKIGFTSHSDDPTALVGLPLIRTARMLRAAGCVLP